MVIDCADERAQDFAQVPRKKVSERRSPEVSPMEKCIKCDLSTSPYCLRCSSTLVLTTIMRLSQEVAVLTRQLEIARGKIIPRRAAA